MAPPVDTISPSNFNQDYYSSGLRAKYNAEVVRLITNITQPSQSAAEIAYEPNLSSYLSRSAARARTSGLETEVPKGWPQALTGPMAWTGSDLQDESEWVFTLSDDDKREVNRALEHFKSLGLSYNNVSQNTFPLPSLAPSLLKTRDEIYQGRGLAVIRGLEPDAYSSEDFAVIFLGISSYIAEMRGKQDQRGSMIIHVVDRDPGNKDNNIGRGVQPFHADVVCDTLALATRSCSAKGGHGLVASAWTVYNTLAATRPDLVHTLAKPNWPHDTYGRSPAFYNRALLYHTDDKIILNFSRRLLTGHSDSPRTPGIPGLTEDQAEALDAIEFIAQKHQFEMVMKKGDLRFINNMSMVHCREVFEDDEKNHRHLLRLWLSNQEKKWKLDPVLEVAWARVFEDQERDTHWDVSPVWLNGKIIKAESCD